MNRREFFQTSAAVAASAALPELPVVKSGTATVIQMEWEEWPVEQFPMIHSDVQWNIANEAWCVAAWTIDPPLMASDFVYHKENLEVAEQRVRFEVAIGVLLIDVPTTGLTEMFCGPSPR